MRSAIWDEASERWALDLATGERVVARYCVMATGLLSAPKPIDVEGWEEFAGRSLETSSWPREKVDFRGRRVGIIGTGSSGVQAIPVIAREAGHLTVFQRTPNFSAPRYNGPLDPVYEQRVKADYRNWRRLQLESFGGYISVNFQPLVQNPNRAMEVSPEERQREFEFRWRSGGLCFYTSFQDLLTDPEANEELAEFFRRKIAAKIDDPATADELIPRGYPILTKRLCADDGYFETFNRDNVSLVDLRRHPIDRIRPEGVEVAGRLYELDALVFATGFDAVTGALVNIDIRGLGGRGLEEEGSEGPRTNAGLVTAEFPNMFFVNGPGSCTGFFNPVLNAEFQGAWLAETLEAMPDGEAWAIERIDLITHNGTHLDAPYHFASTMNKGERAITIDEVPLEWCFQPGVKLDFTHFPDGYVVQKKDVEEELRRIDHALAPLEIVLVKTRAGSRYGHDDYVSAGCGMGREATLYLLEQGVRLTGIDTWSWDAPFSATAKRYAETGDPSVIWEGHKAGLEVGYCHLEKLHNLEALPPKGFMVSCFPFKIRGASAGFTRAVAIFDDALLG